MFQIESLIIQKKTKLCKKRRKSAVFHPSMSYSAAIGIHLRVEREGHLVQRVVATYCFGKVSAKGKFSMIENFQNF